jgi:transposase
VWTRILSVLQRAADAAGHLDWATHHVDGTVVRAHQHAAGAQGGQAHEALGRSRGGFSTKVHLRAEGGGKPLAFAVSGGERHESRYVQALLDAGSVRRSARGRPRRRPDRLVGDRGYSYPTVRLLARRHIGAVIPHRRDQHPDDRRHAVFDHVAYRERNRVERLVNRLKQYRRVATRYDKRAVHYLAMVTLAALLMWL